MRSYIIYLFFIFFTSVFAMSMVVMWLSPSEFNLLAPALFYLFLFLILYSALGLCGFLLRRIFSSSGNKVMQFFIGLRQSAGLALSACLMLFMVHYKMMTWWIFLLIIIFFTLMELLFVIRGLNISNKK